MATIVSRQEWGARPPTVVSSLVRPGRYKVHWTVGCAGAGVDAEKRAVKSIQDFHMDGRGWADIAYNYLIGPSGTVYVGRGDGVRSAANGNAILNYGHQAVAVIAGPDCPATDRALNSLAWFLNRFAPHDVRNHRDGYDTACPGSRIGAWVDAGEWQDTLTERGPSYFTWRAWRCSAGPWTGKGKAEAGATYRPRIPRRGSPRWPRWWLKFRRSGGCK